MEKHQLLSLVKKTAPYFGEYSSPTSVYESLWDDEHFKFIINKMTPEDIILFSFLIPINNKKQDIDETYDRIENNMYSVEVAEIYDSEPEMDCPECHDGHVDCSVCDGSGEVPCERCDSTGEEDCMFCDGSGQDDEGEDCDSCEGDGKQTCSLCDGSSYESCDNCGGDGDLYCTNCDSSGKVIDPEKVLVEYVDYISWSPRWKDYFFRTKPDEQLDNEDAKNFSFNPQTIILGRIEQLSEEYPNTENGDTFLYMTRDTKDLTLTKKSDRISL
jgi:hypothetical protein